MKSISIILVAVFTLLSSTMCSAGIKNGKTETIKIYGNCGMCEKTIEKAGNVKNIASVDWNKETKMATISYDATKTNQAEILKRIALAGYDSDSFLAPNDTYENLPGCCQYDRTAKVPVATEAVADVQNNQTETPNAEAQETKQLNSVFDNYFLVKDVLVQTNGAMVSEKSKALLASIKDVKMEQLSMDFHKVWMKVLKSLEEDAAFIANTKSIEKQRNKFMSLTKSVYALMKVAKYETPVYYQHCPMYNDGKDANWLSKEIDIKNPYYGSQMLNCGKTIETLK